MEPLIAHFTVRGGKIEWLNETALNLKLPRYEGMKGILTVKEKWRTRRSPEQNSYMHVCMKVIADFMGENPKEVKRIMKGLFAPRIERKFGNRTILVPKPTSQMTKPELAQFLLEVGAEVATMGVTLPDPELYKIERDTPHLIDE